MRYLPRPCGKISSFETQTGLGEYEERTVSAASPEVNQDDHACDRRVRSPQ